MYLRTNLTLFSDSALLVKMPCHCSLGKIVTIACYASHSMWGGRQCIALFKYKVVFYYLGPRLLGLIVSRHFNEHSWFKKQPIMLAWDCGVAVSLTESPPSFSSTFCTLFMYPKLLNFVIYSSGKSKSPIYIFWVTIL